MFRLQIKRGKRGTLRGQGGPRSGATIWIGSPDSVDPIALRVLVLHELIHAWIGPTNQPPRNGGKWHGPAFRRLLVDAARAAWAVEVTPAIDGHRYETDRRIERALRAQEVTT